MTATRMQHRQRRRGRMDRIFVRSFGFWYNGWSTSLAPPWAQSARQEHVWRASAPGPMRGGSASCTSPATPSRHPPRDRKPAYSPSHREHHTPSALLSSRCPPSPARWSCNQTRRAPAHDFPPTILDCADSCSKRCVGRGCEALS